MILSLSFNFQKLKMFFFTFREWKVIESFSTSARVILKLIQLCWLCYSTVLLKLDYPFTKTSFQFFELFYFDFILSFFSIVQLVLLGLHCIAGDAMRRFASLCKY